jgi:hypothetical protein
MTHPLITAILDPEAGQIEILAEAQLLIDQCATWEKVAEIMLPCLRESPADLQGHLAYLYNQATVLIRKEMEEQCQTNT